LRSRQLLLIFALALAARLGFLAVRGTVEPPDTAEYRLLARNVLRFHTFSMDERPPIAPAIRRPPVYPIFLASLMTVTNSRIAPAIAQAVLDALIAVMIFLIASRAVRQPFAIAVAVFYAIHPGPISATAAILSEVVFTTLLCTAALFALIAAERVSAIMAICSGIAFGLAALTRSIGVVYLIAVLCVLLAERFRRIAVIAGLSAIIVIAPWIIRSSRLAGRFVFIQAPSSLGWYLPSLWWLDQNDEPGMWRHYRGDPYGVRLEAAKTPAEVMRADDFGRQQTIANIRRNPRAYLQSRMRAFPHLFLNTFDPFTGINHSLDDVVRAKGVGVLAIKLTLLLFFSVLPMAAALLGLPASRQTLAASIAAAIWLITLAFHVPVWIEYRYWRPALPFHLVTAALGIQMTKNIVATRARFPANGKN
jgi:4-amino-4-deoxy-L-arabinose transferase-like glycosyltransferase